MGNGFDVLVGVDSRSCAAINSGNIALIEYNIEGRWFQYRLHYLIFRIIQCNKIKMECDDGTIPTTDELVKTMKKSERKDKVSGRS